MSASILWIVKDAGWNDGTLACRWTAEAMATAGISVTVQPLRATVGSAIAWPGSVQVNPPIAKGRWGRSQRRRLADLIAEDFDRVICDMDFDTEFRLLESAPPTVHTYLLARQPEIPEGVDGSLYGEIDRILAVSRTAHRAVAHARLVMDSRLWLVPPLVDWGLNRPIDWPFGGEDRMVVCVAGVLGPTKGLEVVCNALTVLNDRGRRLGLLVLGDGPDRVRLQAYAQALGVDAVFQTQPENWGAWIRKADIVATPQFSDGMAFEVDAARFAGTPVVGTQLSAIEERLGSAPAGHLMEETTVMGLVDLIENVNPTAEQPMPLGEDRQKAWIEAMALKP